MVQLNYDATQYEPSTGYTPVPAGWYNVAITKSEMKPTAKNDGAYLQLNCTVLDGTQMGKAIFVRLNLQNKSEVAVDIANKELSAICHVAGVYQVQDSSQLHNIPFQVRVIVTKQDNGNEGNDVKEYKDAGGNAPGQQQQASQGQPAAFGQPPMQQQAPPQGQQQGQAPMQQAPQGQPPTQQAPATQGQQFQGGQATQQAPTDPAPTGNAGWGQQAAPTQGAPAGGAPWGQQAAG